MVKSLKERTRSTLFDIVYADHQRVVHLVLIDEKLKGEAVLKRHDGYGKGSFLRSRHV